MPKNRKVFASWIFKNKKGILGMTVSYTHLQKGILIIDEQAAEGMRQLLQISAL